MRSACASEGAAGEHERGDRVGVRARVPAAENRSHVRARLVATVRDGRRRGRRASDSLTRRRFRHRFRHRRRFRRVEAGGGGRALGGSGLGLGRLRVLLFGFLYGFLFPPREVRPFSAPQRPLRLREFHLERLRSAHPVPATSPRRPRGASGSPRATRAVRGTSARPARDATRRRRAFSPTPKPRRPRPFDREPTRPGPDPRASPPQVLFAPRAASRSDLSSSIRAESSRREVSAAASCRASCVVDSEAEGRRTRRRRAGRWDSSTESSVGSRRSSRVPRRPPRRGASAGRRPSRRGVRPRARRFARRRVRSSSDSRRRGVLPLRRGERASRTSISRRSASGEAFAGSAEAPVEAAAGSAGERGGGRGPFAATTDSRAGAPAAGRRRDHPRGGGGSRGRGGSDDAARRETTPPGRVAAGVDASSASSSEVSVSRSMLTWTRSFPVSGERPSAPPGRDAAGVAAVDFVGRREAAAGRGPLADARRLAVQGPQRGRRPGGASRPRRTWRAARDRLGPRRRRECARGRQRTARTTTGRFENVFRGVHACETSRAARPG